MYKFFCAVNVRLECENVKNGTPVVEKKIKVTNFLYFQDFNFFLGGLKSIYKSRTCI